MLAQRTHTMNKNKNKNKNKTKNKNKNKNKNWEHDRATLEGIMLPHAKK